MTEVLKAMEWHSMAFLEINMIPVVLLILV